MKLLGGKQIGKVEDAVRAKIAMMLPVLSATLHSLARDRIERLGGVNNVTLHDLAREFRGGHGDAGICFEYAVHEAVSARNPLIYALISEVLEDLCKITGGAESILFGPEKEGVIPILESVQNALTDDSVIYVGNQGRPPKLKGYIPQIINAYRRNEERNRLPRSISGLWKADLFLGNKDVDGWVGTTIKINPNQLQPARGLRLGIYPKRNAKDTPRKDSDLNLIRVPLPYDGEFMEAFYKAFFLVRAFLKADAMVPPPVELPDAEDQLITKELERRREYPILEVIGALTGMAQPNLVAPAEVENKPANAVLSADAGLQQGLALQQVSDAVSVTPEPGTIE